MKEKSRNVAVGLTVIGGLIVLAAMIFMFAKLPEQFAGGYELHARLSSTGGAEEGDFVNYRGIRVGRVTDVSFTDPKNLRQGITVTMRIESQYRLPGNINVYFVRGMMGSSYIDIQPDGPQRTDPDTGEPLEYIPTDEPLAIRGIVRSDSPVAQFKPLLESFAGIAEDLKPTMKSISQLAENLNRMIAPRADANAPATAPGDGNAPPSRRKPARGLAGTAERLNRTLDALYAVLGDMENQENLRKGMANLARATARMDEAMGELQSLAGKAQETVASAKGSFDEITRTATAARKDFDDVSRQVVAGAEKLSKVMTTINKVAAKIDEGEGSAGKLVNDPKLYNELVAAVGQMKSLMKDLRALTETWKKTGLQVKLK
jgi:phospholipid/cholesterol/gamma-HCH transport system substrate-binding protein